jgi:hypothetical protein
MKDQEFISARFGTGGRQSARTAALSISFSYWIASVLTIFLLA